MRAQTADEHATSTHVDKKIQGNLGIEGERTVNQQSGNVYFTLQERAFVRRPAGHTRQTLDNNL